MKFDTFSITRLPVADDVTYFKPGMRVAGQVTNGAFAEEVIANSMVSCKNLILQHYQVFTRFQLLALCYETGYEIL